MALFAIGDLHLCLGVPKPMDIFGGAWMGYMDKLKEGMSVITAEDTVVLLGDLSAKYREGRMGALSSAGGCGETRTAAFKPRQMERGTACAEGFYHRDVFLAQ